jgi:2-octaprenyl-6-methoxyphenol hydroxylase
MEILPGFENLEIICPASVSSLKIDQDSASIEYEGASGKADLEARLVVAADGANSFIRETLGIESERYDYGQTAVICNITPQKEHQGRAFECFTPAGPFAVMPHVAGRCGLIWCVASEDAPGLMEMPEEEFLRRARKQFGASLGEFVKMGVRFSYPLKLVRALEDVRPRVVIVGNAAHAIHPIGAQGFNLGLRDVAVLAEVLHDEVFGSAGKDPGDSEVLRRYSAWRVADQKGTIAYSDGLARIFANPSPLVSAARTAGLFAHALLPPLRRQLAARAMGFRGNIPRLALGEPLVKSS